MTTIKETQQKNNININRNTNNNNNIVHYANEVLTIYTYVVCIYIGTHQTLEYYYSIKAHHPQRLTKESAYNFV